jgi:uncharacterized repeat protein (TIGR02543 family)
MKFKTMIAMGVGTLVIGATSLAVVANVGSNSQLRADSTVTLYVQAGSYWDTGSYGIWHWGSGSSTWSSLMTAVDGVSGLYATSISSTDTSVIFVEFNSGTATPSWGSKKYQTGDLTYGTNHLYTLTSTTAGDWSTYTPAVTSSAAPSSSSAASSSTVQHTVSEYQVIDGDVQSSTFATLSVADGGTCDLSAVTPTLTNATFIGWYTDSACTSDYTTSTITSDINVYARFVSNICLEGSVVGWDNKTTYLFTYDKTAKNYSYQKSFAVNEEFKIHNIRTDKWLGIDTSIFTSDNFSGTDNIVTKTADTYTLVCTSASGTLAWVSCTGLTVTYTISEYEVVDGVLNSTAIATQKAKSDTSFTPTDIAKTGYTLNGWYTDSACSSAYTATTWNANGSLYAKYTTAPRYDVYFAASGWTNTYVYVYGNGEYYGAWPGTKVTAATTGVNFLGQGGLYKLSVPTDNTSMNIIFNNGDNPGVAGSTKTNDLKLTLNTSSFYSLSDATAATGDTDKAAMAKVVFDINAARVAVTASGSILAGSYCGISKATATSLLAEYDGLDDAAKAYMAYHNMTDYTYNYSDTSAHVDVEFSAIIAQLRLIAASGSGASYVTSTTDTNAWIFGAIAVSGLAVAGLFLTLNRKRKEN